MSDSLTPLLSSEFLNVLVNTAISAFKPRSGAVQLDEALATAKRQFPFKHGKCRGNLVVEIISQDAPDGVFSNVRISGKFKRPGDWRPTDLGIETVFGDKPITDIKDPVTLEAALVQQIHDKMLRVVTRGTQLRNSKTRRATDDKPTRQLAAA